MRETRRHRCIISPDIYNHLLVRLLRQGFFASVIVRILGVVRTARLPSNKTKPRNGHAGGSVVRKWDTVLDLHDRIRAVDHGAWVGWAADISRASSRVKHNLVL